MSSIKIFINDHMVMFSGFSKWSRTLFLLTFCLIYCASSIAQEPFKNTLRMDSSAVSEKMDISAMAFIVGTWEGELAGAKTEETWNPSSGGTMMGMFKLYSDEGVQFYELMTIKQVGESITMLLRHFSDQFHAWEEKNEVISFPFIKAEKNRYFFNGLTFEKISPDKINIYVIIDSEDGSVREEKLMYKRK